MSDPEHPIIFNHFPELKNSIGFIKLGKFPSPVQRLKHLGHRNLWIKRDDLNSDVYGGNKIRKLEFILAHVLKKKKSKIITFGGIGTNHGLATAIFANQLGIGCRLLLFKQPLTCFVKNNMLLFLKYGAELKYYTSVFKTTLAYYFLERIKNPSAYFLYAGGSTIEGTIGFINAAYELKYQIDKGELPEPSYVFCPLGSNGTVAGLTLGCRLAGLKTKIIGVRVTFSHLGPIQACTDETVLNLMKKTYAFLRKKSGRISKIRDLEPPEILCDYVGDGYGFLTGACRETYHLLRKKEKITLDPTYTAKTFSALMDYLKFPSLKNKPILYWHTYNSLDLSEQINSIDYHLLPEELKRIYEEKEVLL